MRGFFENRCVHGALNGIPSTRCIAVAASVGTARRVCCIMDYLYDDACTYNDLADSRAPHPLLTDVARERILFHAQIRRLNTYCTVYIITLYNNKPTGHGFAHNWLFIFPSDDDMWKFLFKLLLSYEAIGN